LKDTLVANLFFGNIFGAQVDLIQMAAMISALPEGTIWSGAGIGSQQKNVHAISLAVGGGVRTGIEDSIFLDHGNKRIAKNAELVERVHEMAKPLGRVVMSPEEFKAKLN
jgi:uncharacterized protein (DUF849 family)